MARRGNGNHAVGSLWLKFKVWTKLLAFALLVVYVLTFISKNIEPHVDLWVWYFRPRINLSVLLLALVSFLIGVLGTILSRTTIKTFRQIRQIQERARQERVERELEEMRTKAAMLRSRPPGEGAAASEDVSGEQTAGGRAEDELA